MSSLAKGNISISKKDLTKTRIPPVASRNVVFYHKASLGQSTIDLLSLTMPSEMPSQVQATVSEINGAKLYNNRRNLSLVSSSKGELIQGLDYIITSAYTINLIGAGYASGTEVDEIFVGTINSAPISDLAVASAKSVSKTYELAVGQTVLNLGREYKVGENPLENIGVIKVFVNGVIALRDVDYVEVNSGNGYGSTIEFFVAPATLPYQVVVDFGVLAITDQNALGDIQNLAGSVKKIADDLAVVAGTSAEDYFAANPSEVERRTFGDWVLKMLDVEVPIVSGWQSYTPTGSWTTNTTYIGKYRRIGDSAEFEILVSTNGLPNSGELAVNLPFTINTSKTNSSGVRSTLGSATVLDSGVRVYTGSVVALNTTSVVVIHSEAGNAGVIDSSNPIVFNATDSVSLRFSVPIQGWQETQKIRDIIGV